MIKVEHYAPILKGKEGEYRALAELDDQQKSRVVPIIEIPPIPYDHEAEAPSKTMGQHLQGMPEKIAAARGFSLPIYLDASLLDDEDQMPGGSHPADYLLRRLSEIGILCMPVVGPGHSGPYVEATRSIVDRDGRGACLRLAADDLEDPDERISSLLSALSIQPADVDLLIDLGWMTEAQVQHFYITLRSLIASLPSIAAWRSLVFAASSFPLNLSQFSANSTNYVHRSEYAVWRQMLETSGRFARIPSFGDYGISHPDWVDVDPRIQQMSAGLRYTTDEQWLVFKGRGVKRYGYEQSHDICQRLISMPEYSGEDFSWGDDWIMKCANREVQSGNATTWRKAGTNHHLAFVTRQLASQTWP